MMKFIAERKELKDYYAGDVIVRKAAAMLFVKVGIVFMFMEKRCPKAEKNALKSTVFRVLMMC